MSVSDWGVIIGVAGTLLLQIIGRVQAWQLAVIAARSEAAARVGRVIVSEKVDQVHYLVDGARQKLQAEIERLSLENRELTRLLGLAGLPVSTDTLPPPIGGGKGGGPGSV